MIVLQGLLLSSPINTKKNSQEFSKKLIELWPHVTRHATAKPPSQPKTMARKMAGQTTVAGRKIAFFTLVPMAQRDETHQFHAGLKI